MWKWILRGTLLAGGALANGFAQDPVPPPAATAQVTPGVQSAADSKEFDLSLSSEWIDTGIDIKAGDSLKFTATGTADLGAKSIGPEGASRGFSDLIKIYPLNDANKGAVIGRIGKVAAARPFLVGNAREVTAPVAGRLYLAVNMGPRDPANGTFHVTVDRTAAAASTEPEVSIRPFSQARLDSLPARVSDPAGAEGDRINFIIIGSQAQVQKALTNAGWVVVDRTVGASILSGVLASLTKQAYVTIPMSELVLFGRAQDFGYAQADPLRVVASRHHFRIWKAPFTHDGSTVWIGAGTHDIGFDRDQRNGKLTHKIDPEVDGERDYIGESLTQTGMVAKLDYMMPRESIKEARTAHGEAFRSDGRTLIIYLRPASGDRN